MLLIARESETFICFKSGSLLRWLTKLFLFFLFFFLRIVQTDYGGRKIKITNFMLAMHIHIFYPFQLLSILISTRTTFGSRKALSNSDIRLAHATWETFDKLHASQGEQNNLHLVQTLYKHHRDIGSCVVRFPLCNTSMNSLLQKLPITMVGRRISSQLGFMVTKDVIVSVVLSTPGQWLW